ILVRPIDPFRRLPYIIILPKCAVEAQPAQHRIETKKPARRDGRNTLAPRGTGQRYLRRGKRLGKIMRGNTGGSLRRGDAEGAPHLPRQPGIMLRGGRPAAFVEPPKDDQIRLLQPRLEKTPDRQSGMPAEDGAHHGGRRQGLEQGWEMTTRQKREIA